MKKYIIVYREIHQGRIRCLTEYSLKSYKDMLEKISKVAFLLEFGELRYVE